MRDPPSVAGVPVLVAGAYDGPLSEAIRRLKYQSRPDLARPLASLLTPLARTARARFLTWVPVPLHPTRLAERGFNQSALLASALASSLGGTSAPRALERLRDTGQQALLERVDRESNVRAAFRARGRPLAAVGLIDDVITTGATAAACVETLRAAGTTVSLVLALASAR